MNEGLLTKLKRVRAADIGHLFLFLLALLPAAVLRRRRPHIWLVCETADEARDNGYRFFRFLRAERPDTDAVYAIRRGAPDAAAVTPLGETVEYGSLRHWIYYLAAEVNISSQKNGKPNAAVCYLLEVTLRILKNKRVFLQHGVTKDDLPFLHYDRARLAMFSCAAGPEYEFVRDTFGYPEGVVRHVGLCRFDALHGLTPDASLVLIVPTWRMWLQRGHGEAGRRAFLESDYYRSWSGLINSPEFDALLEKYGKRAVFCLHRNMGEYETALSSASDRITVLRWQDADIPALLRQAGTLITDFSSVYMDFAYMHKPVVYYQFDREAFRAGHLPDGYFDYERDGFGPVCADARSLLRETAAVFGRGCVTAAEYISRAERFYTLHDDKNCLRTFDAINDILGARP